MRMLHSSEMIPLTIDCICIDVFYSIRNRAVSQLVILKVNFLLNSPVVEIRLFGFKLRTANAVKNKPGNSIKMPRIRTNSITYPPLSFLSMFTWRCASIRHFLIDRTARYIGIYLCALKSTPAFLACAHRSFVCSLYSFPSLIKCVPHWRNSKDTFLRMHCSLISSTQA